MRSDRVSKLLCIGKGWRCRLHPDEVGVVAVFDRTGDAVVDSWLHQVEAFASSWLLWAPANGTDIYIEPRGYLFGIHPSDTACNCYGLPLVQYLLTEPRGIGLHVSSHRLAKSAQLRLAQPVLLHLHDLLRSFKPR